MILTRSDVRSLLDIDACIDAVRDGFLAQASGRALASGVLGTHVDGGGFHVKTSGLASRRRYFAAKVNANFPGNRLLHGLPTIQGVIALYDATNGVLLALMDSTEITTLRTAAATAVAAQHLARSDSATVTVIGCGVQGRSQLLALSRVRSIAFATAYDSHVRTARDYAEEMSRVIGCTVEPVDDYRAAARKTDIIVTCTSARAPVLGKADIREGTFIAAVGADSEVKQELDPSLLASSKVVVDVLEQCATIGDLHHAIDAGVMRREDVHAELSDVVSGRRPGRESDTEVIVFDSTGTALEDVAAASFVYERALKADARLEISLIS
ncbi:MAG TPA: ornithine cyclodeaminase family protein [Gemmatimonadaceae bacterium]|nr:ornithine cyclodeaminase family protein [Gemmatimonadaceae bacterium]